MDYEFKSRLQYIPVFLNLSSMEKTSKIFFLFLEEALTTEVLPGH